MRLIVLTGEAKVGKTNALKLLEKINDGTINYFQDDIRVSDLLELTLRDEKLGVVTTNDERVKQKVDSEVLFCYFSR
jgi:tRNA uridine 5-carbamoylmethylation protein Kti12